MKHLIRLAIIAALISVPSVASAATAAELQAQAQALLQQVQALQAQLTQAQAAQGGYVAANTNINTNTNTVVSSAACPLIGRVLKLGSTGDDVTRLQKFLAQDYAIYPEALITGYYGSLTEAAVKRWQVKYNIVSSGTAESTGYGVTGPRTAAAISLQCSTYGTSGGSGQTGPVGGFIQVTPVSGYAPMKVTVQATVNTTNSCSGATYTLNWGDGTAQQVLPVPAGVCTQVAQTYAHTYIYGGTYIVRLAAGGHETTATVVVSGVGAPATPVTPTTQPTFSIDKSAGDIPLAVTFTTNTPGYLIDFGDGTSAPLSGSIVHTYTGPGTYYTRLLLNGSPVTSSKGITATTPTIALGPLAVSPNHGGNPLGVQVQFNTDSDSCSGNGTTLAWGDGTSISSTNGAIVCGAAGTTHTYTHTYAQTGNYSIVLTRNSRTDTASLTITN
jgi:PKD repeat protein